MGESCMKHIQKIAVMFVAVLLSVSAFAANKDSVNLTLNNKAVVNGTTLEPGDYKIVLNREGDSVQATFFSGRKAVATATGHFEQRNSFPAPVAIAVHDGDRVVQQIMVSKMKGAMILDSGTAASAGH